MSILTYNPFTRKAQRAQSTIASSGSGTAGKIPKWISSTALGDSICTESAGAWTINGNLAFSGAAQTIAGIENQNLLDKTAAETVSNNWTFAGNILFDAFSRTIAGIENQNLLDKTSSETITGRWTFSDWTTVNTIFFNDTSAKFNSDYTEYVGGPTLNGSYNLYSAGGYLYLAGSRDSGNPIFNSLINVICKDFACNNINPISGNVYFDNTTREIAGIQNQNLVDKTVSETISGSWSFTNDVHIKADSKKIYLGASDDMFMQWNGSRFDLDLGQVSGALPKTVWKINWEWLYSGSWYDLDYYGGGFALKATSTYGEVAELHVDKLYFDRDSYTFKNLEWDNGQYITTSKMNVLGSYEFVSTVGFGFRTTYSGGASTIFSFKDSSSNVLFSIASNPIIYMGAKVLKSTTAVGNWDFGDATAIHQPNDIWLQGNISWDTDTGKARFGAGQDAEIWYDGTDLKIDSAAVGSGTIDLVSQSASSISTEALSEYITIKVGGVSKKLAIVA